MNKEGNILIIVEGAKTEPAFFKRLATVFDLKFEICCFKTNIYSLYKKMKEYNFNADIKDILKEILEERNEQIPDILDMKFAYTYLIFDCDAHHPKKEETRSLKEVTSDNFSILKEMTEKLNNETDPAKGKLYINYPMMESYRDCDGFFDPNYENREALLSYFKKYKQNVGKRKLSNFRIDKYERKHFESLMLQNLFKWNKICFNLWQKPSGKDFFDKKNKFLLLDKQKEKSLNSNSVFVINTSLFLIVDFYGNRNNFYDSLTTESK